MPSFQLDLATWTDIYFAELRMFQRPADAGQFVQHLDDHMRDGIASVRRCLLRLHGVSSGSGSGSGGSGSSGSGRVMNFVNKCDRQVTVQIVSGSTAYASGKTTCASNADCAAGGACNTSNGICYGIIPTLANGGVLASGASTSVTYPYYASNTQVFSGGVIACFGAACRASFGGTTNPATRAEFTLLRSSADTYDLSIIDGFNLPMEMAASGGSSSAGSGSYWCGNPGSQSPASSGVGACSWTPSAPGQYYVAVSDTEGSQKACSSNSDCTTAGEACGAPIDGAASAALRCAPPYGYFHAARSCERAGTCGTAAGSPNAAGITVSDLFMCDAGLGSCYSAGATTACCGCANWGSLGITVPSSTQTCGATNPNWTKDVLPSLQWMKSQCPSAYVYPFDDLSSTFTCSSAAAGTTNTVAYTITLCPQSSKLTIGSVTAPTGNSPKMSRINGADHFRGRDLFRGREFDRPLDDETAEDFHEEADFNYYYGDGGTPNASDNSEIDADGGDDRDNNDDEPGDDELSNFGFYTDTEDDDIMALASGYSARRRGRPVPGPPAITVATAPTDLESERAIYRLQQHIWNLSRGSAADRGGVPSCCGTLALDTLRDACLYLRMDSGACILDWDSLLCAGSLDLSSVKSTHNESCAVVHPQDYSTPFHPSSSGGGGLLPEIAALLFPRLGAGYTLRAVPYACDLRDAGCATMAAIPPKIIGTKASDENVLGYLLVWMPSGHEGGLLKIKTEDPLYHAEFSFDKAAIDTVTLQWAAFRTDCIAN
ncbi:hypothetical protein HK405_012421, partial [Cladochytrium tenue]